MGLKALVIVLAVIRISRLMSIPVNVRTYDKAHYGTGCYTLVAWLIPWGGGRFLIISSSDISITKV